MPRCLIVDDDGDGREGYAEYLRAFGFDVEESEDGETAWELINSDPPDILLLDLQLPGVSGWTLVERIRATEELGTIPIVAVSACVFPEDRQRAERAGCDAFLSKPSVPSEVLTQLRRVLSQRSGAEHEVGTPDA